MAKRTDKDMSSSQRRLAQDAVAMTSSLERRARLLKEAIDSFYAGDSQEEDLRRVYQESFLAGG